MGGAEPRDHRHRQGHPVSGGGGRQRVLIEEELLSDTQNSDNSQYNATHQPSHHTFLTGTTRCALCAFSRFYSKTNIFIRLCKIKKHSLSVIICIVANVKKPNLFVISCDSFHCFIDHNDLNLIFV